MYTPTISMDTQKWWFGTCISLQIWLFFSIYVKFRGYSPPNVDVEPDFPKWSPFPGAIFRWTMLGACIIFQVQVSHRKKPPSHFPWNPGYLIGIVIMVYDIIRKIAEFHPSLSCAPKTTRVPRWPQCRNLGFCGWYLRCANCCASTPPKKDIQNHPNEKTRS